MSNLDMTEKRFKEIVASYGTAQERWPAAERELVLAFIKKTPSAKKILDDAATTDDLLNMLSTPKPADKAFLKRLATMPPPKAAQAAKPSVSDLIGGFLSINLQGFMPRAVGLASVCALGIMLGLSNVARFDNTVVSVDASSVIFGATSLENDLEEIN